MEVLATSRHSSSQPWIQRWAKGLVTPSAPKPATKYCLILLPNFHLGGNAYGQATHLWEQEPFCGRSTDTALETGTLPAHSGTSQTWGVTVARCACRQVRVSLQQQDADLTKIHLKSTGKTSSDSVDFGPGLWLNCIWALRASCIFCSQVFSCSLQEKNISKIKVYPPGCAQEKKAAPPLQNSVWTWNCWKQCTEKELKYKPSGTSVDWCDGKGML